MRTAALFFLLPALVAAGSLGHIEYDLLTMDGDLDHVSERHGSLPIADAVDEDGHIDIFRIGMWFFNMLYDCVPDFHEYDDVDRSHVGPSLSTVYRTKGDIDYGVEQVDMAEWDEDFDNVMRGDGHDLLADLNAAEPRSKRNLFIVQQPGCEELTVIEFAELADAGDAYASQPFDLGGNYRLGSRRH